MNNYAIEQRELLSILFKERRKVIIVFCSIFLFFVAASFIMPAKYEAEAKLLIKSGREFESRPDPGQAAGIQPYLTKQEVMNSELEILSSNDLIKETIDRVGLDKLYPGMSADDPQSMDDAIKAFHKALKVDTALMSEVITLTYLNKNRAMAIQALNTLLQIYQEKHTALFTDNRSAFLEQKNKDYNARLDDIASKITDLRQSQNLFDVPTQRSQIIQDRSVVAETLRGLQTRSLDEHGRINFYRDRLKTMSPFAVADGQDNRGSAAFLNWKKNDPAFSDPLYDDALLKLQSSEANASALDQQIALQQKSLDAIDARLSAMEKGQQQLESMEREHAALEDMVHSTRSAFEQALTNEDMDRKKIVSVDVFEKPDASMDPAKPRKMLYALVGFALGLISAAGIIVFNLVFRQTFVTSESVERILGIKVLATIPERG